MSERTNMLFSHRLLARMKQFLRVFAPLFFLLSARAVDFSDIEPLLQQHCVECHGGKEPEGSLVLESHADLLKGGESGAVVVPGKAAESLLVKALEGNWGKTGKNQFMPPGKRDKLKPEQVALFKAWIAAGAPTPKGTAKTAEFNVPKIAPKVAPRRSIHALACSPTAKLLAVARHGEIELHDAESHAVVGVLTGSRGAVNAVAFSADDQFVFAAAGEPGLSGEVRQWKSATGEFVRVFEGHRDALYSLAVSPDGQTLATGSYDYTIKLWNVADGTERKTITASQGAILDLAFRPDGKLLASASADRTAKLYDVATGERRETFGQALKELNAVAWSPDGRQLVTGGGDNRIRIHDVSPDGKEGSNKLLLAKFAHEGAILRLQFSPDGKSLLSAADDRTVKLFETGGEWNERVALESQPDWPTAVAFLTEGKAIAVGRLDGSLGFYNATNGKVAALPKPELLRPEPRGVQRGIETKIKLLGKHLGRADVVSLFRGGKLFTAQQPQPGNETVMFSVKPQTDEPRGPWEVSVTTASGESARVKLWVDDLPQMVTNHALPAEPVSVWGTMQKPGQTDDFTFTAKAGQTLVFDLAARSLGAKGDFALALLDAAGKPLERNDSFDGGDDPLLTHTFAAKGTYRVRVTERMLQGSAEHFYRLSVGALPFITGVFPLSLPANTETAAQLLGFNLPDGGRVKLKTGGPGELGLPAEAATFRARREWKLLVTESTTPLEVEPNDTPTLAQKIPVPALVNGRIGKPGDVDLFAFTARQGTDYLIETAAAQRGSPVDTKLAVLWPGGRPVERIQLRAVRNSAVTFRGTDANGSGVRLENWEEMELNDFLYFGGEVVKHFRMPQGPDSDMLFYTSNGKRRPYFDTTAVSHPLDEPAYIVVPEPVGTKSPPNGLPVFHLNFGNDDDSLRQLGTDSRIHFTAPVDGTFLVRVSDARGFGGERFVYVLTVRESRPDFRITLNGASATVPAGSGQSFSITAERFDGFEGAIKVVLDHLPKGWTVSTPLVIEAGHNQATGTLHATTDALAATDADWDAVTVVAAATIEDRTVALAVNNLGRPKLGKDPAKLVVSLTSKDGSPNPSPVLVIAPGQAVTAHLSVKRNGFTGAVRFEVENLPHGVIVDDLGLNGITFLEQENERDIRLTAARWVADLERPIYAVETATGRQTSAPLILKVSRAALSAKTP